MEKRPNLSDWGTTGPIRTPWVRYNDAGVEDDAGARHKYAGVDSAKWTLESDTRTLGSNTRRFRSDITRVTIKH